MKRCEKCRTLYSEEAAACPKCGVREYEEAPAGEKPDKGSVARDWIWLAVGIPLFIGLIYLLVYVIKLLG